MTEDNDGSRKVKLHPAAELVGCCYHTVWRAVQSGELPATRRGKGGNWKVRLKDLYAWDEGRGPED